MNRSRFALLAAGVAALVALAQLVLGPSGATAAPPVVQNVRVQLSGVHEVPENVHGNGDRGVAEVSFDPSNDQICWQVLELRLLDGEALPHAGHIHIAPRNVAGPIVVHFFGTGDGVAAPTSYPTPRVCRPVDGALLDQILASPGEYYVNLHNATHPSGVVRDQLKGPVSQ
ncbi:MAG: CHRD domain-containing protein [Actinomycetota bacterium]